jgi:ribonuclease E
VDTFASTGDLTTPPPAEPELNNAVADLDAPTPAPRQQPVRAEEASPAPPAEPTRRRSTVRERAPIAGSDEAAPIAAPPNPSPAAPEANTTASEDNGGADDSAQPRRTGWWSRRFAGGG